MNVGSVPSLLSLDHFDVDEEHPHIEVNHEVCRTRCTLRACLTVCPAEVYSEYEGDVAADFAACLECGMCVVACLPEALSWSYPRGGQGISYRYG
ncbi:MAG: ferredoxin family protein [Acidimicrobiales bacterium]|jgi:ferredoxin like protein